tara:strand:- start:205 stop:1176 length:972 start_codon:yes stop_codon:yes gene_type:complete
MVLGAGTWGTALSIVLNNNAHKVTLWHYKKDFIDKLGRDRIHPKLNCNIPSTIKFTNNINHINKYEMIVIAIPTQTIRETLDDLISIPENLLIVNASKGIEVTSLNTVSNILEEVTTISKNNIIALYGPSHAEEVVKKLPTTIVAASDNIDNARLVQDVFSNQFFRVYSNNDIIGVEIAGSIKNIIAIAAGISVGVGFGDNTLAALITRGIAEIKRLGLKMGAKESTFVGLSGIGDLIVTATSLHSRNRKLGYRIGQGEKYNDIIKGMTMIAEGVETSKAIYKLSKKINIEMPICNEVYNILFKNKDPKSAINDLMSRKLIDE